MELRQLRYFAEAAESLNFTDASKALFISQSTLSQQIKQLENELGVSLFDRIGKRVYLTEVGVEFLAHAKKTLQAAESGKQKIMDLQNLKTGILKIGVTYTLSILLADALVKFSKKYPFIKLEIVSNNSEELFELLNNHKIDMMLSFNNTCIVSNIISRPLFNSSLSVIVHANHPFCSLKSISFSMLDSIPLILLSKGFTARRKLDEILKKKNIEVSPVMELNDVHILLQLVNKGNWATILSNSTAVGHNELKAIPLQDKECNLTASLYILEGTYISNSMKAFEETLLNMPLPESLEK
ncbi:MAG: LysR substrate-binding domain-containing protein [Bacteroidales bacterium]|nr:LysR substrate-binding domain-containing protein [Bacteroidales bacterium]